MKYKCDVEGCKASYERVQALGIHKRTAHGIIGKSSTAIKRHEHKAEQRIASGEITLEQAQAELANASLQQHPILAKRKYEKRTVKTTINKGEHDTQILIFIGRITAYCEAEAERLGTSKSNFTKRCAQLFYASQVG